ncbi:MAG: hypothetical protein ACUBOA_08190 [Candidatus Loosdrechtia sp.]|uniref:hypothetical protein n=1 Tax=Candidatus Loosdrechtia sp. TaxID=3101272 RepID=UPI003A7808A6|nr:MAG: hypothetical protein QY305_06285 [Candidatus Jettenia sp. AMX2]
MIPGIAHAQRVGKVANLVIFLGILSITLSVLALTVSQGLSLRGYGFRSITLGVFMIGLGYGIRYRYKYCLYGATILFIILSGSFLYKLFLSDTSYLLFRLILCSWVSFRLVRAISSMETLILTNAFPVRSNRFMEFFLRRRTNDNPG